MDTLNQKYLTDLPPEYGKVDSMVQIYQLKVGKKKWVIANLEFIDTFVLVYSATSDRYWQRELRGSYKGDILAFVREGILYMVEDLKCSDKERTRRETMLHIEYLEDNKGAIDSYATMLKMMKGKLNKL